MKVAPSHRAARAPYEPDLTRQEIDRVFTEALRRIRQSRQFSLDPDQRRDTEQRTIAHPHSITCLP